MLVKNWMSKNVITVEPEDSMQQAISLMKEHKIRMLPVLQRGKLVGVVSDTDLKRASASDATMLDVHEMLYLISKIKIKDIMATEPFTVSPDFTVEEAAEILMEHKISGLPVVEEGGKLVGVITRDDLFNVLIALSGLGRQGIQFAFQIEDRAGSIKELTDVIRDHEGKIASILSSYDRVPAGFRNVYIRIYDIPRNDLPELQAQLQKKAKMIYVVDHRENRREICHDIVGA
jgi:acetoin utilization protein AcuB